jgi:penicillin-binding protein 2
MLVLAVFAVLFLRLWALQILSGSQYLDAARNNQLRTLRVQAPRGAILDRNGVLLVGNTAGRSVQIWPADLPKKGRYQLLQRLSRIVDVPVADMAREIAKRKNDPLTPVIVKRRIERDQVIYLEEHGREFPGVRVAESYLRHYPFQTLAAQLLGHVGEASPKQLARNRELRLGDEIGQGGVESSYDEFLRGSAGLTRLRVDSLGRPRSGLEPEAQPQPGHTIRLTLDVKLQRAAERALRYGIDLARENDEWAADGGAVVALDPRDGQVLALASNPTFKPSVYVEGTDRQKLAKLVNPARAREENYPGLNRALAGLYPPGSTWKPVTALAAMEEHELSPYSSLPCTPTYEAYDQVFRNWNPTQSAMMTLPTAIAASCDTYFYEIGKRFFDLPPERGHPQQAWASQFGFGAPTGIDLGPEAEGLLPTPEWRLERYEAEIDRIWKPGYSIQLAIGQGDLLVTPLQMARFYAMIANGGRLVTPYVVADAETPGQNGEAVVRQRLAPPAAQRIDVDPGALAAVREGLLQATHFPLGTSAWVFDSFPLPVAGKTGTAEKWSSEYQRFFDQSWWCGYAPADDPELVVCALIENGGHGSSAAAPVALKVFERHFGVQGVPTAAVESE